MIQNYRRISPQRKAMLDFFDKKEKSAKSLSLNCLNMEIDAFISYCRNFNISTTFDNWVKTEHPDIDESCRQHFLSAIDTARECAKVMNFGASTSVITSISNNNHQEQSQTVSIEIDKALRKKLTVDQYEEITRMINNKTEENTILKKLSEFGKDVLAGVLSSIISSAMM